MLEQDVQEIRKEWEEALAEIKALKKARAHAAPPADGNSYNGTNGDGENSTGRNGNALVRRNGQAVAPSAMAPQAMVPQDGGPMRRRLCRPSFNPVYAPRPKFCVFCGAKGYTDSCRNILGSENRSRIIREKNLCRKCLKLHNGVCRKNICCIYCSSKDHHRSLCSNVNAFEERAKKAHHC